MYVVFSSSEPKAPGDLIGWAVVRRCCLSSSSVNTLNNISSEITERIGPKFHLLHPGAGELKVIFSSYNKNIASLARLTA